MLPTPDLIWIIDNDPACVALYQQTLGLQYGLRILTSVEEFSKFLESTNDGGARLVLADPENMTGSLAEYFAKVAAPSPANESKSTISKPDFVIVSKLDDLELMRFYLKTGARDYILKPIRPNELVAKVEKALAHLNNREILILRNEFDGIYLTDLTFREHQLLTLFLSRPERSVSREDLYNSIWNKVTVNRKTLDVHLFNLRRKLRPHGYDIFCRGQLFSLSKSSP